MARKKKTTKKKWTSECEAQLKQLAATCDNREDISTEMKRTGKSIERKADKLGILLPSKYKRHRRSI